MSDKIKTEEKIEAVGGPQSMRLGKLLDASDEQLKELGISREELEYSKLLKGLEADSEIGAQNNMVKQLLTLNTILGGEGSLTDGVESLQSYSNPEDENDPLTINDNLDRIATALEQLADKFSPINPIS